MTYPTVRPKQRIQPRTPSRELEQYIAQRPKPIEQQILELRARIHELRLATLQLLKQL